MNIIILGDKFQKRMKSKGCVGLFKVNQHTAIEHQISSIRSYAPDAKIIYVYGFESKKFLSYFNKHISPKYSNIDIVYNEQYNKYNYAYSLYLAQEYLNDDCMIVFGDQIFKNNILNHLHQHKNSQIFISSKQKNKLGCIINNDQIAHISYGLNNYVHNMYYLDKHHSLMLQSILVNSDQFHNCFIFELINKLIDSGQHIKPLIVNTKFSHTIKI